jgi:tetratricopeptide (TPR) repeat protein
MLLLSAVNLDPSSFEAVNNLGSAYLAKEEYGNAASNFQKAIILEPDNVTAKYNLGKTYGKSGDYENAKQVLIDVIKQDKKLYDAYIEVANVCTALGDLDSAEGYLLTLQELNPSYRKDEVAALLQSFR